MKTLYESILDDEDVLISKTKKDSQNWLLTLKLAMLNNASDEDLEEIINQDIVKKEVSKIFYKFDDRMKWLVGKYTGSLSGVYCILKDTKERSKYRETPVLSFMKWNNDNYVKIHISNIYDLTKTASKNVKPTELLKFKQHLLNMGAEYAKTGAGIIQENVLKI
jgi:hypothetical protein